MNFIRTSLVGRERVQDGSELEQQRPTDVEEQTRNGLRSSIIAHPGLRGLFAGRPSWGTRGRTPSDDELEGGDGPKSPTPNRFHLPTLGRSGTQNVPNQLSLEDRIQDSETPSQPSRVRTRAQRFPVLVRPPVTRTNGGESERHVRRSRFGGSDPAELHLVELTENGRQQRAPRRRDNSGSSPRRQRKEPPKRFLFCFPWVKSRRARALILRVFVSGIFLILMLTICMSCSRRTIQKLHLLTIQHRPLPFYNQKYQFERVQYTADPSYYPNDCFLLPCTHPSMYASRAASKPTRYLRNQC